MKKTWQEINSILHNKKIKNNQICLRIDGNIINEPKEVGNKFNEFFTTVANKLVEKIRPPKRKFNEYLKNPTEKVFL